jgi:hypothetical protein
MSKSYGDIIPANIQARYNSVLAPQGFCLEEPGLG